MCEIVKYKAMCLIICLFVTSLQITATNDAGKASPPLNSFNSLVLQEEFVTDAPIDSRKSDQLPPLPHYK